jgi:hypothetical protein
LVVRTPGRIEMRHAALISIAPVAGGQARARGVVITLSASALLQPVALSLPRTRA